MPAPVLYRQKLARATIDRLFGEAGNVWVVHYSCESIHDRVGGRSPRITSIAVRRLDSGQTLSFSIHLIAEETGQLPAEIEEEYDGLERKMLNSFYEHVRQHRNMKYLHWSMRDTTFGFVAIEHRYRV